MGKAAKPKVQRIDVGVRSRLKTIVAKREALTWRLGKLALLNWYAITARSGDEALVEQLLERRGLIALVPMQQVHRRVSVHAKRTTAVKFPLLPRYVFVAIDTAERWGDVFGLNHRLGQTVVTSVIGLDGKPWRMNGAAVAQFLMANGMVVSRDPYAEPAPAEFHAGDDVTIEVGAFAGWAGKIASMTTREARILLPMFGTMRDVQVPLANLAEAD